MNSLDGNGYLVQTVDKIDDVDADGNPISRYVSGRVSTTGIVSPLYGFFEARLDTLPVEGMQSAWWLWAENGLWNYDWGTVSLNKIFLAPNEKIISGNRQLSGLPWSLYSCK